MALNKRKVLDAARKHAQKGAKAKALKEYNKLLKADPRDAKLLLEVGDAYRRWGQPEEAISQYNKVAAQYRQDGFDARAVAVFKQILTLDAKHYPAHVSLSELYQRMGLDSEAVAALQVAADGYHKEGRKPEALDLLRQMAALDPSNTTSRLKVAELLRQEGMEDDAIIEYQAVVTELAGQQDSEQLIAVQDRILEIRPDHLETLTSLVRNLMTSGTIDRAEPLAVHALNVSKEPAQYELLIDLYAQMGNDAKLAEATRGLAKHYRNIGDEEKARELMQRLPAQEMAAPDARLGVDLSETEEPTFDDEELLDEPFLATDDDFEMLSSESSSSLSSSSSMSGTKATAPAQTAELSLDEVMPAAAPVDANGASSDQSLPLPEGDPDQLLAEASVYLRYGKRDQAIASLRSVIAQEPNHRRALEKLGEAYADGGQNSDAVATWLKAAEQVRLEGDAEALDVLRDRIAALDPGVAERVGEVDPNASRSTASASDSGNDVTQTDSFVVDLELDVEVDLDLDDAIDEIAASDGEGDLAFPTSSEKFEVIDDGADDEFEIDLDDESAVFGDAPIGSAEASATKRIETSDETDLEFTTEPSIASDEEDDGLDEFIDDDDDSSIEFEIDTNDLSADEFIDDLADSASDAELDADAVTSTVAGSNESAAPLSNLDDELEEAEFYIAQDMFDEAEPIVSRVLAAEPIHARALVLMGEIAAARAGTRPAGQSTEELATDLTQPEPEIGHETSAPIDEESSAPEMELDERAPQDGDPNVELSLDEAPDEDSEISFEVELDLDLDGEVDGASDDLADVATDDASDSADSTSSRSDIQSPDLTLDDDGESEFADAVEDPEPEVATAKEDDSQATFDLREALSDVIEEESTTPAPDTSGVLSTVEDGFESIFSDFKQGINATLEEGDFDTRYDLGIAYREMGLFDDAIAEFRVCLDSPDRRFDSLYLMGICARDLSRWDEAVNHLEQALALPDIEEERMAGVYFDLSIAEEHIGDSDRALSSVKRVIAIDADFPGAADRLRALESGESALPEMGEPGEKFESFDDLFEDEDDEGGDEGIVDAVPAETFESFDDVVAEAEAESESEPNPEPDPPPAADKSKKSRRKKISFV